MLTSMLLSGCGSDRVRIRGVIAGTMPDSLAVDVVGGESLCRMVFSTAGADKREAYGMLKGAPVTVEYRADRAESREYRALRIVCDRTYADAVGRWTMPDPIAPRQPVGVELRPEGVAVPIRTAALCYECWELEGSPGVLLLHEKSAGDGLSAGTVRKAVISERDGRKVLSVDNGVELIREP